jgi:hypothetical protein
MGYLEFESNKLRAATNCLVIGSDKIICLNSVINATSDFIAQIDLLSDTSQHKIEYPDSGLYLPMSHSNHESFIYEIGVRSDSVHSPIYLGKRHINDDNIEFIFDDFAIDTSINSASIKSMMIQNDTIYAVGTFHILDSAIYWPAPFLLWYSMIDDSIGYHIYNDTNRFSYTQDIHHNSIRNSKGIWIQGTSTGIGVTNGIIEIDNSNELVDVHEIEIHGQYESYYLYNSYIEWSSTATTDDKLYVLMTTRLSQIEPPYSDKHQYSLAIVNLLDYSLDSILLLGEHSKGSYPGYRGLARFEGGCYAAGTVNIEDRLSQISDDETSIRISKVLDNGLVEWQHDYVPNGPKNYVVYSCNYSEYDSILVVYGSVSNDEQSSESSTNPFYMILDWDGQLLSTSEAISSRNTSLYPNPSSGIIRFKGVPNGVVTVHDIHGKLVHQSTLNSSEVDLSFLTNGVYTVSWADQSGMQFSKLVISH